MKKLTITQKQLIATIKADLGGECKYRKHAAARLLDMVAGCDRRWRKELYMVKLVQGLVGKGTRQATVAACWPTLVIIANRHRLTTNHNLEGK